MLPLRLKQTTIELLRCPVCKGEISQTQDYFKCSKCEKEFPVIAGVPILINEERSVFRVTDFLSRGDIFFDTTQSKLYTNLSKFLPNLSLTVSSNKNFENFKLQLLDKKKYPRVLILGCGVTPGIGSALLLNHPSIEVVETDVSWGPRTMMICDAHDIPFADGSFDGVVAQAVLEHVMFPYRCVEEIYRVLGPQGLVYAETPFMAQVHGGRYDFTRFSDLGHRCLFRGFQEIDRGLVCGPGMALAWSYEYFLSSFTKSRTLRKLIRLFARLTAFYLKYFDYLLVKSPGALDAAFGLFFMGQKLEVPVEYRELLNSYRGMN
jgi:SAM-dependent methyltransferase